MTNIIVNWRNTSAMTCHLNHGSTPNSSLICGYFSAKEKGHWTSSIHHYNYNTYVVGICQSSHWELTENLFSTNIVWLRTGCPLKVSPGNFVAHILPQSPWLSVSELLCGSVILWVIDNYSPVHYTVHCLCYDVPSLISKSIVMCS